MIRISQPLIGPEEEEAVLAVLRSGQLVQGPRVAEFEEAFARMVSARHAVAVSSGTTALVVALRAHDISAGDEVIVPAFTYAATANAVLLTGATPVLVDIRAECYNIDPTAAEAAVTPRTRAIVPVHLYGHPCDMTAIGKLARKHGLAVIEDAAQAVGASWQGRGAGTFGTGCFSFYATKNMTTGEGGMIVTNEDEIAQRARALRSQGEGERYRTDLLSGNYRLTELAAAIGLAQLSKLAAWNERRRANAAWLSAHLDGVVTPVELPGARHVYHQYTVRVPSTWDRLLATASRPRRQPVGDSPRDALRATLREQGIEAVVYYERCLHQQPLYQGLGIGGSFPIAERAAQEVLSLPVHPGLSLDDLERIASAVNGALAGAEARRG